MTTDSYIVKNDGIIFEVEEDPQNLWTFPVGVSVSKTFTTSGGWTISPRVDAGVIFATGKVHGTSRTSVPGVAYTAENTLQVMDLQPLTGAWGLPSATMTT